MKPRIIFMGSPEFALPSLRALANSYPVIGVVTQPDRPAGRGRTLTPPPVKSLAQEYGLPMIQPRRLREPQAMTQLRDWQPDVIVVAAFGQILKPDVLELPPYGCVNVHASLLPRWRGAAPIRAAILHGDEQAGITIMCMDPGIDTGPILNQRATPIQTDDTAETLSGRLGELGAQLLLETLPGYLDGELAPEPQDESQATYAPMLKKEDGELDFQQTAVQLSRRVRAYHPWPGAFTTWNGKMLKIQCAHPLPNTSAAPGERLIHLGLPAIGTAQGILVLDEIQPAGKKNMPGEVFLRGARDWST
jgi:methionyl-tRNA formyltransferase